MSPWIAFVTDTMVAHMLRRQRRARWQTGGRPSDLEFLIELDEPIFPGDDEFSII